MQSKLESMLESLANILTGIIVAVISQRFIFPYYGIIVTIETNIQITLWFTLVSMVRSYIFRRMFNKRAIAKLKKTL